MKIVNYPKLDRGQDRSKIQPRHFRDMAIKDGDKWLMADETTLCTTAQLVERGATGIPRHFSQTEAEEFLNEH